MSSFPGLRFLPEFPGTPRYVLNIPEVVFALSFVNIYYLEIPSGWCCGKRCLPLASFLEIKFFKSKNECRIKDINFR